ncbi:hypothetical protein M153_4950006138, partial [Pseudoloma neurophilia]
RLNKQMIKPAPRNCEQGDVVGLQAYNLKSENILPLDFDARAAA